jgi:hypothetical protein
MKAFYPDLAKSAEFVQKEAKYVPLHETENLLHEKQLPMRFICGQALDSPESL